MSSTTTIFDRYIAGIPPDHRRELARIRDCIYELVPGVSEATSYGMPAFKYHGRTLLWLGNFKQHMSLFPEGALVQELGSQLEGFKVARGTIQFTAVHPLPEPLLRTIITRRMAMIDGSN